jgi:hypothetical protein
MWKFCREKFKIIFSYFFIFGAFGLGRKVSLKGKEKGKERDLLVQTSLDQLILNLKTLFTFFYKSSYLNEEVNCTEPSP